MNIVTDAGLNNITLTDRETLDSINSDFKAAEEKNITLAKVFETQANINVYKGNQIIYLSIQQSVYSGWTIEAGNKILTSEHIFSIIRRYAK